MSEINTKPTTSIHWADGGSPYTSTDPGSSKKDAGYALNEIPAQEHFNWLLKEYANHVNWLAAFAPREFENLEEAADAGIDVPQRFFLVAPASQTPWAQDYSTQGPGGAVAIAGLVTDGAQLYVIQGTDLMATASADPSTALWTHAATTGFVALAADGRHVYVGDSGVNGVVVIDRNGSVVATKNNHSGTQPTKICGNGRYFALIDTGDTDVVHVYSVGVTVPYVFSYLGSYDHGAAITSMCIQGDALYIGSSAAGTGTYYLRKIALPGLSVTWSVDPGFASTPTFLSLSCDGRALYVGGDRDEVVAGTLYGSVHAFDPVDGSRIWTCDLGAGVDADQVYHDHDLVLAVDTGTNTGYQIVKATGRLLNTSSIGIGGTDGMYAYGIDGAAPNNVERRFLDKRRVEYIAASGLDQYRAVNLTADPLR